MAKKINKPGNKKILTYGMAALALAGGVGVTKHIVEKVKSNRAKKQKSIHDVWLDPKSSDAEWDSALAAVNPYVLSHIISSEGYIQTAYLDNGSNGTLTFGSGFTIADAKHKNFAKEILQRRNLGNGSKISVEENRILVTAWLKDQVYPKIRRDFDKPMDVPLFVSLCVGAYNRGENIFEGSNTGSPIRDAVNSGENKQTIANKLVLLGGVKTTRWGGLSNKYGVCALYYMGHISDTIILDAIAEAPYTLEPHLVKAGYSNGRILIYGKDGMPVGFHHPKNIEQLLLKTKNRMTKGTKQKPVREYLTEDQVRLIEMELAGVPEPLAIIMPAKETDTGVKAEAADLNEAGEELYIDGKYSAAIEKYKQALQKDPESFMTYSNLSLAYYKTGKYEQGAKIVGDFVRSRSVDKAPDDVKAYSYFNAALCRIAIGDKLSKAEKYKDAKDQYEMARININNAEKYSNGLFSYDQTKQNIKTGIDSADKAAKNTLTSKSNVQKKSKFDNGKGRMQSKPRVAPKRPQKIR